MRPSEVFGRPPLPSTTGLESAPVPASSAAGDPGADVGGPPGAAGLGVFFRGGGGGSSNSAASAVLGGGFSGLGGNGLSTAPMMTYFLAEESELDAAAAVDSSLSGSHSHQRELDSVKLHQKLHQHQHQHQHTRHPLHQPHKPDTGGTAMGATSETSVPRRAGADSDTLPPRPSTPVQAANTVQPVAAVTPTIAAHPTPLSNLSPLLSQATTPSFFGTSGPASLAALSASSSRCNSPDSSLGNLGSATGCESGVLSRDPSFELDHDERGGMASGPTDDTHEPTSAAAETPAAASLLLENNTSMASSGTAPQLIMPSIKMPSRRPFTETGKGMGRLKVLIAGDSGIGKTSLIKAIVQSCPHIVHVDHIAPSLLSSGTSRRSSAATVTMATAGTSAVQPNMTRNRRRSSRVSRPARPDQSTHQISESFASTKPYPAWWSELSDAHNSNSGLHRRKSLGDNVLDRNICFVDTPGYTGNTSTMDVIVPVVQYVEGYLQRLCSNALSDADFVGLVSGDGGASVDLVLYLISNDLKPADIEYLRRLTPLTNVIPLIARADTLRTDRDVAMVKDRIARQLHEAGIEPFEFTAPTTSHDLALFLASTSRLPQPYAVSSASGSDHEIMDASLLMSPEYVQPLVPTELATLVEQVFCPDGVARLRHTVARKVTQWRRSHAGDDSYRSSDRKSTDGNDSSGSTGGGGGRPRSLYRPLSFPATAPLGPSTPLALTQLGDHMQREEYLARVRLSNWAADLQRSLDSERTHYEALARSERAVWLTERLGECVQDGTLVAVPSTTAAAAAVTRQQRQKKAKRNGGGSDGGLAGALWAKSTKTAAQGGASAGRASSSSLSHEDPLGLLEVTAGLQARGRFVLEVVGSVGLVGGVVLWMARHNYHLPLYEWFMEEWTRLWNER